MTTSRKRIRMPPSRPRYRNSAEEQSEDDQRKYKALQRIAARQAFRILMLRAHGCTGRYCGAPEHAEHGGQLCDALLAMGIYPDPEAQWELGIGYKQSNRRKREAAG